MSKSNDHGPQCCVCQEKAYGDRGAVNAPVAVQCGHIFHRGCIEKWLKQRNYNSSCPMCKEPTNLKKLVELVWEFDDDDVGPSELNEDATIQEKLRYSEAERRMVNRRIELADSALATLRKEHTECSAKLGELEGRVTRGAASQELEETNDTLLAEITETQKIAEEALAQVGSFEERKVKLEQEKRAQARLIAQVKFQNDHLSQQYEQLKEVEKKGEEKLKSFRYLDAVLGGADEAPAENLSREQLLKMLEWRTKCHKKLTLEKEKRIHEDETRDRRQSQMQSQLQGAREESQRLQAKVKQLELQKKNWERAQQERGSPASSRGEDSPEPETDGYDTEVDDLKEGLAQTIRMSQPRSSTASHGTRASQPFMSQPTQSRASQQAAQQFVRSGSFDVFEDHSSKVIINKASNTAGAAPSLKRVSAHVAAAARPKSMVAGLNRGTFIQQRRDDSGGIVTVLNPNLRGAGQTMKKKNSVRSSSTKGTLAGKPAAQGGGKATIHRFFGGGEGAAKKAKLG